MTVNKPPSSQPPPSTPKSKAVTRSSKIEQKQAQQTLQPNKDKNEEVDEWDYVVGGKEEEWGEYCA